MGSEQMITGNFRLTPRQRDMLEFAYRKKKQSNNVVCRSLEIEPHEFEGELAGLKAFFGEGTLSEIADLAKDRKYLLTEREREVLELIALGYASKEAAEKLFVSKRTVDFHLANTYDYLGVNNRTQAIRIANRRGLIRSDEDLNSDSVSHTQQPAPDQSSTLAAGVPALRIAAA